MFKEEVYLTTFEILTSYGLWRILIIILSPVLTGLLMYYLLSEYKKYKF